ncbi:MAG: hypothetical protein JW795_10100 [Chitinivibrionales bacterium]|nr:hypothetical protein [Chitinivibrionales bacterium]
MRGVYDYPKIGTLIAGLLGLDIDQVAHAIARKHGWTIKPSGETALNILGLSTQVPGLPDTARIRRRSVSARRTGSCSPAIVAATRSRITLDSLTNKEGERLRRSLSNQQCAGSSKTALP